MTKTLLFDIETDGFLDVCTKIHSLVIYHLESGHVTSCADQPGYTPIESGIEILENADLIVGHNILKFDIPVILKLFPDPYIPKVRDTLTCTRLIWPDIQDVDMKLRKKHGDDHIPPQVFGRHSLKAWGFRLGVLKGDFGETTDWEYWSPEMQSYCKQDVAVTVALWQTILDKQWPEESIELEHQFQEIIFKQEQAGYCFDVDRARELYATLAKRRAELEPLLQEAFPPIEIKTPFIPKANNSKLGYRKGVPTYKVKIEEFNPNSDTQISRRLKDKYGWKPTEFTPKGQPKVSEEILSHLQYPEIPLLTEYMMIQKRIGQVAEGKQAWLALERGGKIYGSVITNGAVTGRCTHNSPNVAQVPAVGAPYGEECRSLFYAPKGYSQVGCDASGLELRCLAHYLARYDKGKYAEIILKGDIHTANQKAAGLPTRNDAKRFIYAFLYGAGSAKLGSIVKPDDSDKIQMRAGKKLKETFLRRTPAIAKLQQDVQKASARGYLKGLDGRLLPVRSQHSALNLLLQSAGALVMKKATVILWEDLKAEGFTFGKEVIQVAHIHDEFQLYVKNGLEERVGEIAVNSIRKAGEAFGFRCELDGEYKVGRNWAETH